MRMGGYGSGISQIGCDVLLTTISAGLMGISSYGDADSQIGYDVLWMK